MEDLIDLYQRPSNPKVPVICMDEQPLQLIKEVRIPLSMAPNRPVRYDYEYQRNGTANAFLFTEPLNGWRRVSIRERKTRRDWATEIRTLLVEDYPEAERVILVCDNLNIHTLGALYEAFPPEEAAALRKRLEIHPTPKHGSWLNIAEIELSAFTRQCLNRRIGDLETLRVETKHWETDRNVRQKEVEWQFTTAEARVKLKRLYPQIKMKRSTSSGPFHLILVVPVRGGLPSHAKPRRTRRVPVGRSYTGIKASRSSREVTLCEDLDATVR